MKISCLVSLVLYGALVLSYHRWLSQTWDSPEVWIASCVAALIVLCGLGAVYNSFLLWRDAAVLADAMHDMPRQDGQRTAAAGTLEPLGQALVAPLSGQSCVMYEYDISRAVTRKKKGDGTEIDHTVDFAGLGKCECVIRGAASSLRLVGFPDLADVEKTHLESTADEARARQYVQFTAWEDSSGLGVFHGAHDMWSALTGCDESLRKDWRMIAIKDCPWLTSGGASAAIAVTPQGADAAAPTESAQEAAPDDIEDDELDDDDDWEDNEVITAGGYHPNLVETRIAPGQKVVAIGNYDEVQQGLVTTGTQTIRIYLDDIQTVAGKLAASKWWHLIGGVIAVILVNLALLGILWIYGHSDSTQKARRGELEKSVRDGDVKGAKKVLDRRAEVDAQLNSQGTTALMVAKDAPIAKLLIDRGANVNATDADGTTPLMYAVRDNRVDVVRALIDARADLDLRNTNYGTTALMDAMNAERGELIELLRQAGAQDYTVTDVTGRPIDESHAAFTVCREYLAAVFAGDSQKLRELSTRERSADFDGVDFPTWQESRPTKPRLVEGFEHGDHATVTITGPNPTGADRTWVYQLRRVDDQWRVARERWVVHGL